MLTFDIRETIAKFRKVIKHGKRHLDSVTVSLPFGVTATFKPNTVETDTAREIVIFLADRRVLIQGECCDHCVDEALKSIGEIRSFLVEKQLTLKNHTDSVLYTLIDLMLILIRQFQTYVQQLGPIAKTAHIEHAEENYYLALNCLRGELLAILSQIANIGRIKVSKNDMFRNYPNIVVTEKSGYLVTYKPELYLLEDQTKTKTDR